MKTYAVTGAASGIGAAIKQQLISEGHAVISIDIANADIVADLGTEQGREAAIDAVASQTVRMPCKDTADFPCLDVIHHVVEDGASRLPRRLRLDEFCHSLGLYQVHLSVQKCSLCKFAPTTQASAFGLATFHNLRQNHR